MKGVQLLTSMCGVIVAATWTVPATAVSVYVTGAHVTSVEATYLPSDVRFSIDKAFGACPAGNTFFYQGSGSNDAQRVGNMQGMLATLLTAKASQITINFGGDDSGCKAGYIIIQ